MSKLCMNTRLCHSTIKHDYQKSTSTTRKAAVVAKQTTTVYAKGCLYVTVTLHPWPFRAIRRNNQIYSGAIGDAERCVTARVPQNARKLRFFWVNDTLLEKFCNFEKKTRRRRRFTFYVQISEKSAAEKCPKRRVFVPTKKL